MNPTLPAIIPGTSAAPASMVDMPRTSWKYSIMNSMVTPPIMLYASCPVSAVPIVLLAMTRRSSSGSVSRRWRRRNSAPNTTPTTTAMIGTACQPLRANCLMP